MSYPLELHLYDSTNTTYVAWLHTAHGIRYADLLNGVGSGEFMIPLTSAYTVTDGAILVSADVFAGISTSDVLLASTITSTDKAAQIAAGQVVRLRLNNADVGAFVIEKLGVDDVLEQRELKVSGRTLLSTLERGIVYPSDTASYPTMQKDYLAKTLAYIIKDLVSAAASRGCTLPSTTGFSATVDSDGAAWTDSSTISYRCGTSLLEVALQHADLGIEVAVTPAGALQYYKSGGAGQDRSATVRFREAKNVAAAGRQSDYSQIANVLLGEGQYILSAQTDATSIAAYGRRERLVSHGNVSDATTLATLTQASRDEAKNPKTSVRLQVTDDLVPFSDYTLGDTVAVILPSDSLSTTYRVRGIGLASDGPNTTVELTLNSLADEWLLQMDQALRRRLMSPIQSIVTPNTDPNIGGWNLSTTQLSAASGLAVLHSTGYIALGSGNDYARLDAADATYRLWVGNSAAASAPFRVTKGGALTATNATVSGSVTATDGSVGGWTINSTYLAKDTGTASTSAGLAPSDYPFYAGATYANRASAPFRVTPAGALTSTSGAIGGWTLGATSLTSGSGASTVGLDSGGTNPAIYAGSATPGSAPFRVTKAGALTATSGSIGGWTLGASTLTGGDTQLSNTGVVTVGTSNDVAIMSSADATYRLWIGNATAASAPFRVTKAGYVTATSGSIGGFTLSGTSFYSGNFKLDATNKRLYVDTNHYISYGSSVIQFNGNCEMVNDLDLRGGLVMNYGNGNLLMADGTYASLYELHHGAGALGFYGTTATTKQTVTGSRGSNAALASLLTALAAYGLITDSSS